MKIITYKTIMKFFKLRTINIFKIIITVYIFQINLSYESTDNETISIYGLKDYNDKMLCSKGRKIFQKLKDLALFKHQSVYNYFKGSERLYMLEYSFIHDEDGIFKEQISKIVKYYNMEVDQRLLLKFLVKENFINSKFKSFLFKNILDDIINLSNNNDTFSFNLDNFFFDVTIQKIENSLEKILTSALENTSIIKKTKNIYLELIVILNSRAFTAMSFCHKAFFEKFISQALIKENITPLLIIDFGPVFHPTEEENINLHKSATENDFNIIIDVIKPIGEELGYSMNMAFNCIVYGEYNLSIDFKELFSSKYYNINKDVNELTLSENCILSNDQTFQLLIKNWNDNKINIEIRYIKRQFDTGSIAIYRNLFFENEKNPIDIYMLVSYIGYNSIGYSKNEKYHMKSEYDWYIDVNSSEYIDKKSVESIGNAESYSKKEEDKSEIIETKSIGYIHYMKSLQYLKNILNFYTNYHDGNIISEKFDEEGEGLEMTEPLNFLRKSRIDLFTLEQDKCTFENYFNKIIFKYPELFNIQILNQEFFRYTIDYRNGNDKRKKIFKYEDNYDKFPKIFKDIPCILFHDLFETEFKYYIDIEPIQKNNDLILLKFGHGIFSIIKFSEDRTCYLSIRRYNVKTINFNLIRTIVNSELNQFYESDEYKEIKLKENEDKNEKLQFKKFLTLLFIQSEDLHYIDDENEFSRALISKLFYKYHNDETEYKYTSFKKYIHPQIKKISRNFQKSNYFKNLIEKIHEIYKKGVLQEFIFACYFFRNTDDF